MYYHKSTRFATETKSFVCVIANFVSSDEEEITQFSDKFKTRLIWQLVNSIWRVLQTLLKYFNDIAILTSLTLPSTDVLPVILILDLNDLELSIAAAWSLL